MSDTSQNEKPQVGEEDRGLPSSLDSQVDSETEAVAPDTTQSSPDHGSPHLFSQIETSPHLIRDSGLWVWLWVIGAVVLIAIIIVAGMTLR